VIALVVLVVILGGALVAVLATGSEEAAAAEVRTEPVSTSGRNPFMPSVGTDEPDVTPPPDTAGTFPADTPGLYGGTMREGSCDADALVRFLEANPDKAAAFASVLGIQVADIRSYVATLTPVVLRTDTAVTNHGYANGRATTIPAILQAGTAVMVDKYGTPRVKCYCGNPLTPPKVYKDPVYVGPRWPTFTPTSITIIQQTTVIIDIFVLVDPATGEAFSRPAGTDGADDGPAPEDTTSTSTSSTTSTTQRTTASTLPSSANYEITITGGAGDCAPFSTTSTASYSNGTITFQAREPLSGPVAPDGTFSFDVSSGTSSDHIEGRIDANGLTAHVDEAVAGTTCGYEITGTRVG